MRLQLLLEILLGSAALALLARSVYRTWIDQLRRPITLLLWAFLTAILAGTVAHRPHPNPAWLILPTAVLVWEVLRGWRRAPRCHLREGGHGALAASLVLYLVSLAFAARPLLALFPLALAVALALVAAGLLLRARHREPTPWRAADWHHYERRSAPRLGS